MSTYRSGGIFARQILLTCLAVTGAFAAFQMEDGRLTRDGRPFVIRGVVYSNVPIGRGWSDTITTSGCLYARDFPLIRSLGANTVRTLALVPPSDPSFRKTLETNDLYWLAGFPLDRFYDPNRSLSADSSDGRALREQILAEFRDFVDAWHQEPRLIAFVFGERVGEDYQEKFAGSSADYYSLLRAASAVLREVGATSLLTTSVRDAGQVGSFVLGTNDASQPDLAFWSADTLEGQSLANTFQAFRNRTAKPFLISSFGVDAYDARIEAEDPEPQAKAATKLAGEVEAAVAQGFYPVLGGVWGAYLDEWWRGGDDASRHGTAGQEVDSFPDRFFHPAWLGLFGVARGAIEGLDSLRVRDAYFALAQVWGGALRPEMTQAGGPFIPADGVSNAASGSSLVAPGGLMTIAGEGLGAISRSAPGPDLPNHLGPVSVCLAGEPAPLHFADEGEIRGQVPWTAPQGTAESLVYRAGVASNVALAEVSRSSPGILDGGVFRPGLPCPVDEANGVPPGSYLEVYATGLSGFETLPPTGDAPREPIAMTELPAARLGSRDLPVLYSGLVPGVVGITQTNVRIPGDFPPSLVELHLSQDGISSNPHPLSVISEEQRPGFTLTGPEPATVVLQQGGPGQTTWLEIGGLNSFCALVRFRVSGLPPGVRASIPVGLPGQTVPLTLRAEPQAARADEVPVTITAESIVPETVTRTVRLTVLPGSGDIRFGVISGGWLSGAPIARFEMEDRLLYETFGGGPGRGFNFLTVDPQSGALGPVRSFDTWASEEDVAAMEDYLLALPAGVVVLGAIADDGWLLITDRTRRIIQETLASELIEVLDYQFSWAIIARKGAGKPIAEGLMPNGRVVLEQVLSFPMP